MALDVENVVYGGVGGEEFLRRARALEALHLALPPSVRLMRILGPIVLPSPAVVQVVDARRRAGGLFPFIHHNRALCAERTGFPFGVEHCVVVRRAAHDALVTQPPLRLLP